MTGNASINGDSNNTLNSAKFTDVFTLTKMSSLSEQGVGGTTCASEDCIVGCSCNEDNGWEATTATQNDGYITVTTNDKFAYAHGAKQSSIAKVSCRQKAAAPAPQGCPDGWFAGAPSFEFARYQWTLDSTLIDNCQTKAQTLLENYYDILKGGNCALSSDHREIECKDGNNNVTRFISRDVFGCIVNDVTDSYDLDNTYEALEANDAAAYNQYASKWNCWTYAEECPSGYFNLGDSPAGNNGWRQTSVGSGIWENTAKYPVSFRFVDNTSVCAQVVGCASIYGTTPVSSGQAAEVYTDPNGNETKCYYQYFLPNKLKIYGELWTGYKNGVDYTGTCSHPAGGVNFTTELLPSSRETYYIVAVKKRSTSDRACYVASSHEYATGGFIRGGGGLSFSIDYAHSYRNGGEFKYNKGRIMSVDDLSFGITGDNLSNGAAHLHFCNINGISDNSSRGIVNNYDCGISGDDKTLGIEYIYPESGSAGDLCAATYPEINFVGKVMPEIEAWEFGTEDAFCTDESLKIKLSDYKKGGSEQTKDFLVALGKKGATEAEDTILDQYGNWVKYDTGVVPKWVPITVEVGFVTTYAKNENYSYYWKDTCDVCPPAGYCEARGY